MTVKKEKPSVGEVLVVLPDGGFTFSMFFNRFRVDRIEEHYLLQFGLFSIGETISQYAAVLERAAVESAAPSMIEFLGSGGPIEDSPTPEWHPPRPFPQVGVCNLIQAARSGTVSEFRLGLFSMGAIIDRSRQASREKVTAEPKALLKCPSWLEKHVILSVFQP
jgi:hypothetical protein